MTSPSPLAAREAPAASTLADRAPCCVSPPVLAVAPDPVDLETWAAEPLDVLLERIVAHYHGDLRRYLPAAIEVAREVERRHAGHEGCPAGLAAHLVSMAEAIDDHLMKEEEILFPLVRAGRGALAGMPIRVMELEHEEHRRSLDRLRELTGSFRPPASACASWRQLYARLAELAGELDDHIRLENEVVFPRALGA